MTTSSRRTLTIAEQPLPRAGSASCRSARLRTFATLCAVIAAVVVASLGGVASTGSAAPAAPDSLGTDFWLTFPSNYSGGPALSLFITGPVATTGTVTIPGLAFTSAFTVTPGTVTTVGLPSGAEITSSDVVENLGIHVTALAEVTVYGLSRIQFTTDAYLGLPTDILGLEYFVQGYKNVNIVNGTEFAIVGTQSGTTVTITPSVTTGAHAVGVPYTISLGQGQTYQLRNDGPAPADLSGTLVLADKPIAVFGGHQCANIPNGSTFACDHVVEQMTPTSTWGKSFVTVPLATRIGGDTFRYLASTDGTGVKVNGVTVATLNRGQLFEEILTGASVITSDKPILVTQYSNGTTFDGVTSDPFEVIVPPAEQFLSSYTVTTPASGFNINFINVAAPTASVGSVMLDGAPVGAGSFTPIPGSTFSAAQLSVSLGSHTLSGSQPFGITVYGFAEADSYGYPGGLSLSPVATVTSLTLAPKTASNPINTQHCVTATVKDQNGVVVAGVRVDFTVSGVNPTIGNVNTAANGTAPFCYTGTNAGNDSILAAVGTVSDTASKTWTSGGSTLTELSDAHLWVGLKNSDDQGTWFDVKVELLKNGVPVASGLSRCVNGVTRNPSLAKEVIVPWDPFSPVPVGSNDELAVRVSTRIGTNANNNTKCVPGPGSSHNNARGLRLYYDAASRPSRIDVTISPNASEDLYLDSDGTACQATGASSASANVTERFLNGTAPTNLDAKCKDSSDINFAGGNLFKEIGTWILP